MKKIIVRYPEITENNSNTLHWHPIIQRIYFNRGIRSTDQLERELTGLLPYHDLLDIEKAVSILYQSIIENQRILIIGDYDVDGATATVLMLKGLHQLGAKCVDSLVPDRFESGYGLNPEMVELAKQYHPDLIITVDNGISSIEGVKAAHQLGIKVIITDHHLAPSVLPNAEAIVNPVQPGDIFDSKHLAGVGVAFYVLLALRAKFRKENWFGKNNIPEPNLANYLDLVALGTIADMVKLDKNNRILVHQGLNRIRKGNCCPGIKAIFKRAGRSLDSLSSTDLGFVIGPRLNAAGRMDHMSIGINCLLAESDEEAERFATELESLNEERKRIEKEMRLKANEIIQSYRFNETDNLPLGLCLHHPDWHQGITGILASKVKDHLNRPVIVFADHDEQHLKGSGRSIVQLHLRDVLHEIASKYPELISQFGGHAMAAGLKIPKNRYKEFHQAFDRLVKEKIGDKDLTYKIQSDGELTSSDLSTKIVELIKESGPWGEGFSEPLFDGKFKLLDQRLVGGNHLKMTLEAEDGRQIDAIAFYVDIEKWPDERAMFVHIAYRLDINEFRGRRTLQLLIEHLEPI